MRRARFLVLMTAVALAAAGCGGVDTLSFPNPPLTTAANGATGLTLPANLPSVFQQRVAGVTTTTLPPIGPGNATLNGTVMGPGGPVGGATVQADRVVGESYSSTRVTTAADGSWTIPNILGGRYRVRAWLQPTLAMTEPQIFFLVAGQSHPLTLQLSNFTGPDIASSVNPPTMQVGDSANLLVYVTTPSVGTDGVVRDQPQPGVAVTLDGGAGWTVENGNPLSTDSTGTVVFQIGCQQAGGGPLSVSIGAAAPQPVGGPECVTPAPPTTTCTTPTTSSGLPPGDTSSTTQPGSGC